MEQNGIKFSLLTRRFDFCKDYDIIWQWWNVQGSYPPKPEHLSSTGLITEADSKPVCAGWLYKTDSKICVFEFVVSNPAASKDERNAAIPYLIEIAKELAAEWGYTLIYSSVSNPRFIKRLQDANFIVADTNQTHCFCELENVKNIRQIIR